MVSQRKPGKASGGKAARRNGIQDLGSRNALIEGLSAPPGEHLWRILARNLAVALDVRFGFVAEVAEGPASLKLLAFWTGEAFGENFTYSVKGTPCERVLRRQLVSIEKGVQKAYPEDAWLAEIGAESYLAVPLLGSDGSALGHLGVLNDAPMEISEENVAVLQAFSTRAAGELQRDTEHAGSQRAADGLAAIIRGAPVGILRVDQEGKISFANPRVETMFGYEHEELLGRPVEQLMPSRLQRRHREQRKLFMRDPHGRRMGADLGLVARRKDGSTFPVAIGLSSAGGSATAFITDETTVRQAAESLAQGHARLEAVIQAFPEMTFIMNGEGVLLDFVADGLEPHIPPDEMLGKSITDLLPEEVAGQIMTSIKLALKTRRVQRVEYELTWNDGTHSEEARIVRLDSERVAVFVRDYTVEKWRIDDAERKDVADSTAKFGPDDEIERRTEWRNAYGLSSREFSVLQLLKAGTTDKKIANDLGISVFTVNKHVSNILIKMNAASRTEATIRALQEGLIN